MPTTGQLCLPRPTHLPQVYLASWGATSRPVSVRRHTEAAQFLGKMQLEMQLVLATVSITPRPGHNRETRGAHLLPSPDIDERLALLHGKNGSATTATALHVGQGV
jgi:hypothetical protein